MIVILPSAKNTETFRFRFVEVSSLLNSAQSVYNTSMNIIRFSFMRLQNAMHIRNEYSATGVTGVPDEKEIISTVEVSFIL